MAILAISHITSDERTDVGTGGEKVTVGKPRHPSPPALLICVILPFQWFVQIYVAWKVSMSIDLGGTASGWRLIGPPIFRVHRGISAQRMKPGLNYIKLKRAPTGRC